MGRWCRYASVLFACASCAEPPPPPPTDAGWGIDAEASAPDAATEPGPAWLSDVTAAAGIDTAVPDRYDDLPDRMGGGVCVVDVDGRDPLDLLFALRDGARLFVASAPLAYEDQTVARGLDGVGQAMGCLAFDAEGDGDDDLLITGVGSLRLFLADGAAFTERTDLLGLTLHPDDVYSSSAAGDLDGDGDVDLVVGGLVRYDPDNLPPDCERCGSKIDAHPPIPSLLLRRRDDGGYALDGDLAPDLGIAEPTLVVSITDLDGDGPVDIYVGNDLGSRYHDRALVRGADGMYRDAYLTVGIGHDARGHGIDTMGFSSADIDGDGRIDHVATGFAGHPTAVFLCGADRFCEPQPGDVSGTAALAPTFRWGAALVDLDLDGLPELFEAAGHIDSDEELAGESTRAQPPNLMRNEGGRFAEVPVTSGSGRAVPRAGRGVAVIDLDVDGRPDLAVAPAVGTPALLRNGREPVGEPLVVTLRGAPPNTGGLGARVTVTAAGRVRHQARRAGEGYLGSFSPRLFFAVPEGPARVEVRWASGASTVVDDIAPGARVTVRE